MIFYSFQASKWAKTSLLNRIFGGVFGAISEFFAKSGEKSILLDLENGYEIGIKKRQIVYARPQNPKRIYLLLFLYFAV